MPQSVKERVGKLREEIAEISEANRLYLQGGKKDDRSLRPGTPTAAIAGNHGRTHVADGVEKAVSLKSLNSNLKFKEALSELSV